uniref:Uncharacterized protein n=1 Tax=Arundo donax TaxID=35708 RepID=A0A0A9EFI4_ARUDO
MANCSPWSRLQLIFRSANDQRKTCVEDMEACSCCMFSCYFFGGYL